MLEPLPRAELVALVARLMRGEGTEAQADADLQRLQSAVLHPRVSDLIFWDKRNLTAEQIVEEALAYKPITL